MIDKATELNVLRLEVLDLLDEMEPQPEPMDVYITLTSIARDLEKEYGFSNKKVEHS